MRARFANSLLAGASLLLVVIVTAVGHAQNARFSGQVTDAQNAAIPQAKIDIANQESGTTAATPCRS